MARAAEKCYTEKSLQEVFDTVEEKAEFRDKRGKRHSLAVVIMLYLLGQILGYMSYRSIQRNFSAKENRTKIEERLPIPHGIPSYTTFSRVMSHIPNDILLVEICDWIWQQLPEDADQQLHFGIDGKALRAVISKAVEGINLYMINVYGVALNIFVYMIRVGKKTNERAVIEQNIRDIIHGRNWMISIDAIGTGSNIIDIICEEGCDAVFPVKDNQKTLASLIMNYIVRKIIEEATPVEHYVELDDFSENDTPSRVINNTKCKVVLDDNSGNGPYISEDEETSTETASDEAADSLDSSNSENFKQEPVHVSEETVPHSVNTDKTGSCNLGETVQPSASETPKAALNHPLEEESAQHENPIDSASKDSTSSACNSTENTVPLDDFIFFDPLYDYTSKFSPDIPLNSDNTKLVYVAVGNRLIPMVSSHGRYERREYEYIALPEELRNEVLGDMAEDWHNVKAIGLVTRYRAKLARDRATKSKYYAVTISRTPYILTRESTAEEFAGMVRSHWGSFHNRVDAVMDEDHCTVRKLEGPENVSLLKKLAFNVLRIFQEKEYKDTPLKDIQTSLARRISKVLDFFGKRVLSPFIK